MEETTDSNLPTPTEIKSMLNKMEQGLKKDELLNILYVDEKGKNILIFLIQEIRDGFNEKGNLTPNGHRCLAELFNIFQAKIKPDTHPEIDNQIKKDISPKYIQKNKESKEIINSESLYHFITKVIEWKISKKNTDRDEIKHILYEY